MSTLEPFHGEHQLDPRVSFSYQEYHPSNLSLCYLRLTTTQDISHCMEIHLNKITSECRGRVLETCSRRRTASQHQVLIFCMALSDS